MFTSRVLKSVSIPRKILFSVQEGTLVSLLGMILIGVFCSKFFGVAAVFVAIVYFVLMQLFMIYLSLRDPYFFNLLFLARANKTSNYIDALSGVQRYES
jgi:hypothetical protein